MATGLANNVIMKKDTKVVVYDDDHLVVLARSRESLEKAVKNLSREDKIKDLAINQRKTKYMICRPTKKDTAE